MTPQLENGYTRIANELLEELIKAGLNGTEFAIVLHIMRKTYGYHKKEDEISITQFEKALPQSRRAIIKGLQSLQLVNILTLVHKGSPLRDSNVYRINKNYNMWRLVNKPALVNKKVMTSEQTDKSLVNKSTPTKETITKETIQKKDSSKKSSSRYMSNGDFEKFWKAYPRKVGSKKNTKAKFLKLDKSLLPQILNAVKIQARTEQWQEKKYIPYPQTWVNGAMWEGEYDAEAQKYWLVDDKWKSSEAKQIVEQGFFEKVAALGVDVMQYEDWDVWDVAKEFGKILNINP